MSSFDKTWCVTDGCKKFRECDDALTDDKINEMRRAGIKQISMCDNKCGEGVEVIDAGAHST